MTKNYHRIRRLCYQKCVVFLTSWAAGIFVNVPVNVPDLRQKRTESCGFYAKLVLVKRDEVGCLRLPTSAANVQIMHIPGANNAQKMSQIGAGFTQYNRLDFDTVVTSGQPSLF